VNSPSDKVPELPVESAVADRRYTTRPFYWSVWRELWENRSIYIAPLIVAAFEVFGFAISTIGLADRRRAVLLLDAAHQRAAIEQPYDLAAMMMIFIVFIVGVFYCLDALHGERRDRSILFWKSLPVSDLTTVLSKVTIPLVVLPLIAFAIVVCVQVIMLLQTSVVLIFHGMSPATTWAHFPVFQNWLVLLYGLAAIALWHAPIYERQVFGRSVMLFEHVDRNQVAALGEVRRPSIADLFVAVMGNKDRGQIGAQGAAGVVNERQREVR